TDPTDRRVPRVGEEAAAVQRALEAADAGQLLLHNRRQAIDQRLILIAEEGEGEVLRLGTDPRGRRHFGLDRRHARVEGAKDLLRKRGGDEEAHLWDRSRPIMPLQSPCPAKNSGVKIRAISSSERIFFSRNRSGMGRPVLADSFAISAARA